MDSIDTYSKKGVIFPNMFMFQERGAMRAFRFINKDMITNPSGGIINMSDQGSSKTVSTLAIFFIYMMEKHAYDIGDVSKYTFDHFIFLSYGEHARGQVHRDIDLYIPMIDEKPIYKDPSYHFYTVGKKNVISTINNLKGKKLMIIDEPQKQFSASDSRKHTDKQSTLRSIVQHTSDSYKIFVTATPMTNDPMDMYNYVSVFLNKDIRKVTMKDVRDPMTYKNRIWFVTSNVVNFKNENLIYVPPDIDVIDMYKSAQIQSTNSISGHSLYKVSDNHNKFLNTTRVPMSHTQVREIQRRIMARNDLEVTNTGFNSEYIKLDIIPGNAYTNINHKSFSKTYNPKELYEISPKIHYMVTNEMGRKVKVKSLLHTKNYAGMFLSDKSTTKNVYLFDYFKKYPNIFVPFTTNTRDIMPNKLYYVNIFNVESSKMNKIIMDFNGLPENNASPIVFFISDKLATGRTYTKVTHFYMFIHAFHYTDASQMFGRISRNSQMPDAQQVVYIMETSIDISSEKVKRIFNKTLNGDLSKSEITKYTNNIKKFYTDDGHYDKVRETEEDIKNVEVIVDTNKGQMSLNEKAFRVRYQAMYAGTRRKIITILKLHLVSQIENIMTSQNVLFDSIGKAEPNQLFPKRVSRPEGIYHEKIIPYTDNDLIIRYSKHERIHEANMFIWYMKRYHMEMLHDKILSGDINADFIIMNYSQKR